MRLLPLTLWLCLAAAPAPARAAQGPPPRPDRLPPVPAVRLAAPVVVDGVLDEPAWQAPPAPVRFVQYDPVEGAAPSESTDVWVAFDDEALYVAARCHDSRPDSMIAQLARRDVEVASDRFDLCLDPYHDGRSGYFFGVNAAGVLYDGTLFNDVQSDGAWDAVWECRVRREGGARGTGAGAGAWTLEMRVPFSQLRYRPGPDQVWGIDFKRTLMRRAEADFVAYQPKNGSGFVSRFPELIGLQVARPPRAVELLPYVTGKAEYLAREAGDPFNDGSRYTPGLGGDLRAAVGNSLTLNATASPDFGQVEVDPAVVNLSDVETYFEEKRPFFTENARIFGFGNEGASRYLFYGWPEPKFFYTRRIGRAPQGGVPDGADFSDVPVATRILGAAKLTGKLGTSWNFGTLHAATAREEADYAAGGLRGTATVEPLTYYGVARGLKEFRERRHGLGLMATVVQRRLPGGGLEDALNDQSLMAGLDGWHFLDRKKVWVVSGWAAASRVAGTARRMTDVQRGPLHYLQRPDARHLGVDSSATSLEGYGARLWLNKEEGAVLFNGALGAVSPRFDVNDMGIHARVDILNAHAMAGYRWTKPSPWRRYAEVGGGWYESLDYDGHAVDAGYRVAGSADLTNNHHAETSVTVRPQVLDDRRTRGGPLMLVRPDVGADFEYGTDSRRKVTWYLYAGATRRPATRSFTLNLSPEVEWKPVTRFSLSVEADIDRNVDDAQYIAQVAGAGPVPADFGGLRYVFGRLDQTTVGAGIRLDVSLTPNLSLQTYVQPLISAGRYTDFKELARSRSYDFVHYGVAPGTSYDGDTVTVGSSRFALRDPSFNFKSLRGNAVLRWEYRPGSVFYLVWTQERTDEEEDLAGLRFGPSVRRLLDARANDIFLAKVTYHLGL